MTTLWPGEVDRRVDCMLRSVSGPTKQWVSRRELIDGLRSDSAIAREMAVQSRLSGAPVEEIAARIIDRWAHSLGNRSDPADCEIETRPGPDLTWRCEPRPLLPLDDILQGIVDELVGRGAVIDGEAGGRTMLMWEDRPVFVGRVNEESPWSAAQVSVIAGLGLDDEDEAVGAAIEEVLDEFRSVVRPMFDFSTTESAGIDVWVDRIIAEHEIAGEARTAAIDQILTLAVELERRLDEIDPVDDGEMEAIDGYCIKYRCPRCDAVLFAFG